MIAITRRYRFSASHRLHSGELSDAQNARLYGKCNNPFGHGHNYVLEVAVGGPVDAVSGQVVPVSKLDRLVEEKVLNLFASRNLNLDLPQFRELVPTSENIASIIARLIAANWNSYIGDPEVRFERVHLQETERNGFEILIADLRLKPVNHSRIESVLVHAQS
jgi:6-pyruvoyltetrahydropterin/6-carboxytetrahydropterin synthase